MIIAVTRAIPTPGIALLKKQKGWTVRVSPHDRVLTPAELRQFVKGADAIVSLLTDMMDARVMDAAGPQLKIIANYAVGFNNIDLAAAKKRNIIVTNTPGPLITEAVAEHTIALLLALARRIPESDRYTRGKQYKGWAPELLLGTQLKGKTLGIVGLGRIGQAVAERAMHGLGMRIVYTDMKRDIAFERTYRARRLSLDALLRSADAVTLHVPLLPATHHLMSTKQFQRMKRSAFLINTSRGPIVDEKALLQALKEKYIAGAGLDVYECEPAIDCDLTDALALTKFENVVLTPHTASATVEARSEMAEYAARNVIEVLRGRRPLHPAA